MVWGVLALRLASAAGNEWLAGKPVVGRNGDGLLEVFRVDNDGQLRHRWQRKTTGDWSSWSSLGSSFLPGIGLATRSNGCLQVFAVRTDSTAVWQARQKEPNGHEWSAWSSLGGEIRPPLTVVAGTNGLLELFAVAAETNGVRHIRQLDSADNWSSWSNLGGNVAPGVAAAVNNDGRLELFGIEPSSRALVHCYQLRPKEGAWSSWQNLGGSLLPPVVVGKNTRGLVEVFALNGASNSLERICQEAPGESAQWREWESFGHNLQAGFALGQGADGRLELFAVDAPSSTLLHRWELLVDGSDQWSQWASMGSLAEAYPAVGKNEDGNLEVFALAKGDASVVNHKRQIGRASTWLDWSSLDDPVFQYNARTWQTDEGLPQNSVQALAQTGDGFLWVGTGAGLARFDGITFDRFESPALPRLGSASITALCASRDGALWIGTEGLGLLRWRDGALAQYTRSNGLAGDRVTVVHEGPNGELWVGTTTGMNCLSGGKFSRYTRKQGLASDTIRAIYEDRDQSLWIATGAGLNRLHGAKMDLFKMPNDLPNDSVRSVCQDRGGRIWVGSNNGMLVFDPYWTNFFAYNTKYGLSDTFVSAICEDSEANLWVGTYSGLNRFRRGRYFPELNNSGVPFDKVNVLFEDREGNFWVGSKEGLTRLTPKRFAAYTSRQGLTHNNVMSILEDRAGSVWFGTWGGGLNQLKDEQVTAHFATNGFSQALVLALCEGQDGSLWIGADFDGGLTRLKNGIYTQYTWKDGLLNGAVKVLHEDREGDLWIGTSRGLCRWRGGKFVSMTNQLGDRAVHVICEDRQGALWFGTDGGLSCYKGGKFSRFTTRDGLSDNAIRALYEDPEQTLWIGTTGGGLNRFRDNRFTACTSRQGLFSDEVLEVLEDDQGWLWMSCSKGVFRVRKQDVENVCDGTQEQLASIVYGKADGLESTQGNGKAKPGAWKSRDGHLWFATSKGAVVVDPRTMKLNSEPPGVCIEAVLADRKAVLPWLGKMAASDATEPVLMVAPGRGELEFRYTASCLQTPESTSFKYKLEGSDSDWVEAGTRRTAHYNNVAPGRYCFRVKACNKDGVWNSAGAALNLELQPHYWQTWWWRGSAGLLLIGAVAGTARYSTRKRMQRRLRLLEQRHAIEKERGRIAKDIHDDLGSSLTRIMMLGERAEEDLARNEDVKAHVLKIVSSARETVRSMDEIVWAVNPENDTLEGLVQYISHYADECFENTRVSVRLEMPVQLPSLTVSAEARHDLFLVVKEAFHNVLKHSQATEVSVRVAAAGNRLQLALEDNGGGFTMGEASTGRKGNGLRNMCRRIESLGGRLEIVTAPGQGTRLKIIVPLGGSAGDGAAPGRDGLRDADNSIDL